MSFFPALMLARLSPAHILCTALVHDHFRLIIHKMQEGSIDGLTPVYSNEIGQWRRLSEVAELREMVNKLDAEEERMRAASSASSRGDKGGIGVEHMVFILMKTMKAWYICTYISRFPTVRFHCHVSIALAKA